MTAPSRAGRCPRCRKPQVPITLRRRFVTYPKAQACFSCVMELTVQQRERTRRAERFVDQLAQGTGHEESGPIG